MIHLSLYCVIECVVVKTTYKTCVINLIIFYYKIYQRLFTHLIFVQTLTELKWKSNKKKEKKISITAEFS